MKLIDEKIIDAIERCLKKYDAVEVKKSGGKIIVVGITRKVEQR